MKIIKWMKKNINPTFLQTIFLIAFIGYVVYIEEKENGMSFSDLIDVKIFITLSSILVCSILSKLIVYIIDKKSEDFLKLTNDYVSLVNKYPSSKHLMPKIINNGREVIFPIIYFAKRKFEEDEFNFEINDNRNIYELPKQIKDNSNDIFKAHNLSKIYNQTNIRVDYVEYSKEKKFIINTSRTTYYDSLVTNRAMDYEWSNGKTIRDVYQPGPFFPKLTNSKLSNHLGFNGIIETGDSHIILVKRYKFLSIGKGKYGSSVSASLKTKYALKDEDDLFDENGLINSIKAEIYDELKIPSTAYNPNEIKKGILAFYLDLVEGGKPQFLFYLKLNSLWNKRKVLENFKRTLKDQSKRKNKNIIDKLNIDGKKIKFISIKELENADFDLKYIRCRKKYKTLPIISETLNEILNLVHI